MSIQEIISVIVFVLTYIFIVFDLLPRTIVVFFGSIILIILRVISPHEAVLFINWEAISLLFGMFILVLTLKEVNFFKILGNMVVKATNSNHFALFLSLSIMSAVLSAFMDSITVLMFISTLIIEISVMLGLNPVPFLLSAITSANIGGSATMVGDPPNVIIGTSLGFNFADFVQNVAPISLVVFLVNLIYFYLIFKKELLVKTTEPGYLKQSQKNYNILDKYSFYISLLVFIFTIFLLMTHHLFSLSVGTVGLIGASLALVLNGRKFRNIWERIDWDTLLFFAGLFIIIGALEKTGFMDHVASLFTELLGGNPIVLVIGILIFTGLLSAIMDNVPLAAAFIPIIKSLSLNTGIPLPDLAWALALGTDLGGNGTPIGASANVVGLSIAEKTGVFITWKYYLKKAFPAMIISLLISSILMYWKIN